MTTAQTSYDPEEKDNLGYFSTANVVIMDPADIQFTDEIIDFWLKPLRRFLNKITIARLYTVLKHGHQKVDSIERIRVYLDPETRTYLTWDNKRLWVFKKVGQPIPVLIQNRGPPPLPGCSPGVKFWPKFYADVTAEPYNNSEKFLSVVLRWSIAALTNDKMYDGKFKDIPTNFASHKNYFDSFKMGFTENFRATLAQTVDSVSTESFRATFCGHACELEFAKNDIERYQLLRLRPYFFANDYDYEKSVEGKRSAKAWKHNKWDLVLVTSIPPKNFKDISPPECAVLGVIQSDSCSGLPSFPKIIVHCPFRICDLSRKLKDETQKWYVVFVVLESLSATLRHWGFLNPDFDTLSRNQQIFRELGCGKDDGATQPDQITGLWEHFEEKVVLYCQSRNLNFSQIKALTSAVKAFHEGEKPKVRLIQGPPGTGKTTTLTTFLSITSSLAQRTLVCAPSNKAIREVASRFANFFQEGKNAVQFQKFTKVEAKEEFYTDVLTSGDVVLCGTDERVKVVGFLYQFFLPFRMAELAKVKSSNTGWNPSMQRVQALIGSPEKLYRGQLPKNDTDVPVDAAFKEAFVKFMVTNLRNCCDRLRNHCKVNLFHLPRQFLWPTLAEHIREIQSALEDILAAMPRTQDKLGEATGQWFVEMTRPPSFIPGEARVHDVGADGQKLWNFRWARGKLDYLLDLPLTKDVFGYSEMRINTPQGLEELYLKRTRIVFSTIQSAGRENVQNDKSGFHLLVMDEAGQATEAESCLVTSVKGLRQVVLVGDHKQLPATVISPLAERHGYGRSLFERLMEIGNPSHILENQYRMNPEISLFPNLKFYNGRLINADIVTSPSYANLPYHQLWGPYKFIDASDGREMPGNISSRQNLVEVEIIWYLLTRLQSVCVNEDKRVSVGIISPYKAQVDVLIRRYVPKAVNHPQLDVEINTVDGFQGGEKDVILFSAVCANPERRIGFLADTRRMNVALTRARHSCWVVGHAETVTSNETWAHLVENAKSRNCYMLAKTDVDMAASYLKPRRGSSAGDLKRKHGTR